MEEVDMKKTVLITGTSSGIGKAAAKLFLAQGWNVIATLRNPSAESDLGANADLVVTRLDVQDQPSIAQAIDTGIGRFGQIDALIKEGSGSVRR
jgi:NAD(P)-dependent dehydrogenase (short-subunit alcohol dehydrogenase family)